MVTEKQAKAFWHDFYKRVFREEPDPRSNKGIMTTRLIADHMGMDEATTEMHLRKAAEMKLTYRHGRSWVV